MFETILYPTDFSDYSQAPLFCLPAIPGVRKIIILHVVDDPSVSRDTPYQDPLVANARIMLGLMAKHIAGPDLAVEYRVDALQRRNVSDIILDYALKEGASMIVMGARGKGATEQRLGSVSADVLKKSTLPLLLMKFRSVHGPDRTTFEKYGTSLFARVLVPTDFSLHAEATVAALAGIPLIGPLILLHVVDERMSINTPVVLDGAGSRLAGLQEDLIRRSITAISRIRFGDPAREIVSAAEEEDVSLIAMNPLGEGILRQIRELVIGSTTAAVAWSAERPVLVLRM